MHIVSSQKPAETEALVEGLRVCKRVSRIDRAGPLEGQKSELLEYPLAKRLTGRSPAQLRRWLLPWT